MSVYKRGKYWHLEVDWQGVGRLRAGAKTKVKKRAQAMESTLRWLYDRGRYDLLGLLQARNVTLPDLHLAFEQGADALDQMRATAASPALGPLVDEWLAWSRSPAGVSPKTRRRYSPRTVDRYEVSWGGFFEVLPRGRDARLSDLTDGFVADYKASRLRAAGGWNRTPRKDGSQPSGATLNRDLVALSSFLRWCREERHLDAPNPIMRRERERDGLERWLSPEEVTAIERASPSDWWPLFATLLHTGIRIGEAQGLLRRDVRFGEHRLLIHEQSRAVKTAASVRVVPFTDALAEVLEAHYRRHPGGAGDKLFPSPYDSYDAARRVWQRTCLAAGLHDGGSTPKPNATLHDLRHTYGVMATQTGVPVVRLQKLLGHASPQMTMRYMKHAPEAYFDEDAGKIAGAIAGARREAVRMAEKGA